jgi:hypothetical protein
MSPFVYDFLSTGTAWLEQTPATVLFCAVASLIVVVSSAQPSKYAPGPRALPLLGNFMDFDIKNYPWLTFTKWRESYGAVFSLPFATATS